MADAFKICLLANTKHDSELVAMAMTVFMPDAERKQKQARARNMVAYIKFMPRAVELIKESPDNIEKLVQAAGNMFNIWTLSFKLNTQF